MCVCAWVCVLVEGVCVCVCLWGMGWVGVYVLVGVGLGVCVRMCWVLFQDMGGNSVMRIVCVPVRLRVRVCVLQGCLWARPLPLDHTPMELSELLSSPWIPVS